jgi:hypothetical protein
MLGLVLAGSALAVALRFETTERAAAPPVEARDAERVARPASTTGAGGGRALAGPAPAAPRSKVDTATPAGAPPAPRVAGDPPASDAFAPTSEAARAMNAFLHADGNGDAEAARSALARMREHRAEALKVLEDAYWAARAASAPEIEKEMLLTLATELQSHQAAPLFIEALKEPIREPPADGDGEDDMLLAQAMSRYAALEGLRDLTLRGNREAEGALLDTIRSGHRMLVQEAVSLYIDAGPDRRSRQATAARALPPESHHMLHTVNVERLDDMPPLPVPETLGRMNALRAQATLPDIGRLSPRVAGAAMGRDAGVP